VEFQEQLSIRFTQKEMMKEHQSACGWLGRSSSWKTGKKQKGCKSRNYLAQKNPCPVSFKCRSNICICFQALSAHAVARSQGKRPMLSVNTSTHSVCSSVDASEIRISN